MNHFIKYSLYLLATGFSISSHATEFIVTNTASSGSGSLFDAIQQANNNPGPHTIKFNIPNNDTGCNPNIVQGHSVCSIKPASNTLLVLNVPIEIDGFSQATFAGAPPNTHLVEVNGVNAGGSGFVINQSGSGSTIKGLIINRFGDEGIFIAGANNNNIINNYVGLDPTGSYSSHEGVNYGNGLKDVKKRRVGIGIEGGSHNLISENVISGNGKANIFMRKQGETVPQSNIIEKNKIGTDKTGLVKLPAWKETSYSVYILAGQNTLINDNVITGSGKVEIALLIDDSNNTITNNKIGVGADGETQLANLIGIKVNGSNNKLENNILSGNAIGVTLAHYVNPISGEEIPPNNAIENNIINNNLVGVTQSGQPLANDSVGVQLQAKAKNNAITNNTVANNGVEALPSAQRGGVVLTSIDENGNPSTNYPVSNKITSNKIFNNGGVGIDLVKFTTPLGFADGPTLNGAVGHDGPNRFQHTSQFKYEKSLINPAQIKIYGMLDSYAGEKYLVQFWANPNDSFTAYTLDNFGEFKSGQGQYLIGEVVVTTDSTGHADIRYMTENTLLYNSNLITATTTRLQTNDTSEFSMAYLFNAVGNPKAYKQVDAQGKYKNEIELPNYCMDLGSHQEKRDCIKNFILMNGLGNLAQKYQN
ncbi:right-handed parallel beta-helix repeat-containing protein [Legionella sp. CNM-1927-20]|uniref:right-handed parallel beta-helix repeat-containing protein n=1 Tax=Legionella sp. CNM-1927-20 TaxID=3422221 RepID=UPI00403AD265